LFGAWDMTCDLWGQKSLNILKKKPMGMVTTKEIRKGRRKDREDKGAKKAIDLKTVVDYATQRTIKKWLR